MDPEDKRAALPDVLPARRFELDVYGAKVRVFLSLMNGIPMEIYTDFPRDWEGDHRGRVIHETNRIIMKVLEKHSVFSDDFLECCFDYFRVYGLLTEDYMKSVLEIMTGFNTWK